MDAKKRAGFVKAHRFAKGGAVKKLPRKHFDFGGGVIAPETVFGPGAASLGNTTPPPPSSNWQNQLASNPSPMRMKSAGGPGVGGGSQLSGPGLGGVTQNATNPNTGILGTIGGALGLNNNFQASGANLQSGTNSNQLNQGYNQAQTALGQQGMLSEAFMPQAGQAINEQQALANQYQGIMNGTGPNPAQAELAQNTAQNVNQQAALMAGQRGANANAGLMARQIAQQGAGVQQQAVGQAATLGAQQQIAAGQNLAGLAAQQSGQAANSVAGYNQAAQNEQGQLQGANTAYNNANVGMQSNVNTTNAGTAAGNQGFVGSLLGGVAGGISSAVGGIGHALGLAEGGEVPEHVKMAEMNATSMHHMKKMAWGGPLAGNPLVGNQTMNTMAPGSGGYTPPPSSAGPSVNVSSAPSMPNNQASQKALESGIAGGIKDALTSNDTESIGTAAPWEEGGGMAGGPGDAWFYGNGPSPYAQPSFDVDPQQTEYAAKGGQICEGPLCGHVANFLAQGGKTDKVPAMVSPGEIYLNPEQVHKVMSEGTDPAKIGLKFKGKAKVKGDSYSNDTIPTTLESGGVVIDRKNIGTREKRELFVHRTMAKKKARD